MSTELTFTLQDIIKKAAASDVQGPAAKMRQRFTKATADIVAVVDCSGSMADSIGALNMSKFDHLKVALADVWKHNPKLKVIAFASHTIDCKTLADLPDIHGPMAGGTNLAAGLKAAAKYNPQKTIVISDGVPDNEALAFKAADEMTGSVDCIYCGPDSHPAIQFLAKLARDTGGVQSTWDGYTEIGTMIRGLLPAPSGPIEL